MEAKQAAAVLQQYLRPATFPVAVKLSAQADLPEKVRRPKNFLGYPIAVCQGIAMARNIGWTVGFLREDHACAPSFIVFGLAEEPAEVKLGEVVHPLYGETPEACARTQEFMATLPVGKVKSIICSPLERAAFDPDVVLVYGNPAQIARLVQGALYRQGGAITSTFIGRNSCGAELVAPYLTRRCQVVVPGSGERVFALTQDHEMCFAIPWECLDDVLFGLEKTHQLGTMRYPTPFQGFRTRPQYPEKYHQLEDIFKITKE